MLQMLIGFQDNPLFPSELGGLVDQGIKLLFVIAAILYLAFAVIVIRQVKLMRETVIVQFADILYTIAYIHLATALGVVILFWLIL